MIESSSFCPFRPLQCSLYRVAGIAIPATIAIALVVLILHSNAQVHELNLQRELQIEDLKSRIQSASDFVETCRLQGIDYWNAHWPDESVVAQFREYVRLESHVLPGLREGLDRLLAEPPLEALPPSYFAFSLIPCLGSAIISMKNKEKRPRN